MNEIRKRQKKLYRLLKISTIIGAVVILFFIGAKPYIDSYSAALSSAVSIGCDILVVFVLSVVFVYYSKYGKVDLVITAAENEINDAGYYFSARESDTVDSAVDDIISDLTNDGFTVSEEYEVNDFSFDCKASRMSSYIYIVKSETVDRNDIIAYTDEALTDITMKTVRRKADALVCFVTDNADGGAIALSKGVTSYGRKGSVKIACAIYCVPEKKVYFLGNVKTNIQSLVTKYVMKVRLPIDSEYICTDKLQSQLDLEEKMKKISLNDLK